MKGKIPNIIITIIFMPLIYALYSPFERRNFKKSSYPAEVGNNIV